MALVSMGLLRLSNDTLTMTSSSLVFCIARSLPLLPPEPLSPLFGMPMCVTASMVQPALNVQGTVQLSSLTELWP